MEKKYFSVSSFYIFNNNMLFAAKVDYDFWQNLGRGGSKDGLVLKYKDYLYNLKYIGQETVNATWILRAEFLTPLNSKNLNELTSNPNDLFIGINLNGYVDIK